MAGNLSDYAENKILELSTGKAGWTKPAVWVALYTVAPNDTGGGTEVSGGAYTRIQVADATNSVWDSAGSGTIKNAGTHNATSSGLVAASGTGGTITFPKATASWGTVTAVALVDNSSGGNILWHGELTNPKTIDIDDTVSFATNDLQLSLD